MCWKTAERNAELVLYPNTALGHDLYPMEIPKRKGKQKAKLSDDTHDISSCHPVE